MKFELSEPNERALESLLRALNRAQIQIRDREDVLIWDTDPTGHYAPKAGYIKSIVDGSG